MAGEQMMKSEMLGNLGLSAAATASSPDDPAGVAAIPTSY